MNVKELFDLTGKVAIVTGGSRGLGLEMAEGLAEAGASLAITGRRRQWLDPAAEKLRSLGADVLVVEADVADPEGVRRTVDDTVKRFGGLDILVNNAGLSWAAPSLEFPLEKWNQVVGINLTGVWLMSQAAAPKMIEQSRPRMSSSLPSGPFGGASTMSRHQRSRMLFLSSAPSGP